MKKAKLGGEKANYIENYQKIGAHIAGICLL